MLPPRFLKSINLTLSFVMLLQPMLAAVPTPAYARVTKEGILPGDPTEASEDARPRRVAPTVRGRSIL